MKTQKENNDNLEGIIKDLEGRFNLKDDNMIKKLSLATEVQRNFILSKMLEVEMERNKTLSEAFGTWDATNLSCLEAIANTLGYRTDRKTDIVDMLIEIKNAIYELKSDNSQ